MKRELVFTGSKYEALAGYARAVVVGDRIFVSGTVGYDFKTGALPASAAGQAEQALDTIEWALGQARSTIADVVRVRVFIPDLDDVVAVSQVLKLRLRDTRPANTTVCSPLAVPECKVEIEVEAIRGSAGVAAGGKRAGTTAVIRTTRRAPAKRSRRLKR
jgi:enamine deaminase RidA (YjgF/YER057c/UK114 family)